MQRHADEQELIQRAQNGDEEAFELLIVFYSPALYRVVIHLARDTSEAEGIVQETFWRTWRSLGRYHNDQPFFPYLAAIALNLIRDQWRKEKWVESEGPVNTIKIHLYRAKKLLRQRIERANG